MIDIADQLIDLDSITPDELKPRIRPILAGIMRHEQELDRLRKLQIRLIHDESAARIKAIRDEIDDIKDEIEAVQLAGDDQ